MQKLEKKHFPTFLTCSFQPIGASCTLIGYHSKIGLFANHDVPLFVNCKTMAINRPINSVNMFKVLSYTQFEFFSHRRSKQLKNEL